MSGRKKRQERRQCGRQGRDATGWTTLYQEFYPKVRTRFVGRVASEQDADDLAEEVLAKLARKPRPDDLKAYLASAIANALAGYQRRKAREWDFLQSLLAEAARADGICRSEPRELADDRESSEKDGRIEEILRTLPRKQAQLLRLRFLKGLPVAEVARRLGCSREAAFKRIQRVIKRLRERYGVEPPDAAQGENPRRP